MDTTIVYDKAKWHYEGEFPANLSRHQAFVHIGMYLTWIVVQNLCSEEFAIDFETEIGEVVARSITGARLLEIADGSFNSEMLSDIGNYFTRSYFYLRNGGRYLSDYEKALVGDEGDFYHVQDTWENYDKLSVVIDQRYREWLKQNSTV